MKKESRTAALWGAAGGALASAILSSGIGFGFDIWGDSISQQRAAHLEIIMDFTSRELPLTALGAKYMAAVASGDELNDLKTDIRSKVAQEIADTEKLKGTFSAQSGQIRSYQDALQRFVGALDNSNDATTMRAWMESFGGVIDARLALDNQLRQSVGV